MSTQTLERVETVELQPLMRRISALPNSVLYRIDALVEEIIEELEEAEDIAAIDALTPEDFENAIPLEEVIAEYEAEFGPLNDDEDENI